VWASDTCVLPWKPDGRLMLRISSWSINSRRAMARSHLARCSMEGRSHIWAAK
jgi:hypothetical protein